MINAPPSHRTSSARERLRQHQPVFGVIQTIPSPGITEIAILCGYDFVILDCEHGIVDEASQVASLAIISASPAFSAVRVRPEDYGAVGRYLDFGADCILMADLKGPAAAAAFVAAAAMGPRGTRSSSLSVRAHQYGLDGAAQRAPPVLIAMIESAQAVEQIAAIAQTPGLDGIVMGPNDLSADLGCPGDFASLGFARAAAAIAKAATDAHLILGGGAYPGLPVEGLLKSGHTFILSHSDVAALRSTFLSCTRQLRELVALRSPA